MSRKAQRNQPYGSLQSLPVPTHKWRDLSMDFVTRLPKSKDWRGVEYDSILVIVDRFTKMVHYESVLTTLDAEKLAEVLIEAVIKYHGSPDSIVTDRGSLFTSKFWASLCYCLNVKHWLSTAFHLQTNGKTKRQNSTTEAYLRAYYRFEQDNLVRWLAMVESPNCFTPLARLATTGESNHLADTRAINFYSPRYGKNLAENWSC